MYLCARARVPSRYLCLLKWLVHVATAASLFAPWMAFSASMDEFLFHVHEENWLKADKLSIVLGSDPTVDPVALLFAVGMMSIERKNYERAIESFRKILADNPGLTRVRLELARALFLNKEDSIAKAQFERVLAADIPAPVEVNVRRYLAAIRQNKTWSLDVSLGYMADSNTNNGTEQQTVHFFGIPFEVNGDSKAQSGTGLSFYAKGAYRFRLTQTAGLLAFASIARKDYRNSRYDDMTLRIGAGPVWSSKTTTINVTPLLAHRTYGNQPYSNSVGVRSELNSQLSNRWIADISGEWLDTRNAINGDYSEKTRQVAPHLYYLPSSKSTIMMGGGIETNDSRMEHLSYNSNKVAVGWYQDWRYGLSTGLSWRHQKTRYAGLQPFFQEKRTDRANIFSLSVGKRDWTIAGFMPVLSVSHIRNTSSIPFFGYRRTLLEFRMNQRY